MPPESDVILKIDFDPSFGSPARVFDIAGELIRSFEDLDDVLLESIDSRLETTFILEDLQKSSIKIFLKNVLKEIDDDALKSLDWKQQVGKYLVKAKYAALEWLDQATEGEQPRITDLTSEVARLARESDVRHLPDYPPPNPARLAQSLDRFQEAKTRFTATESLTVTLGREEYSVDLGEVWLPSEYLDDSLEERELSNETDMILVIKKPDFLGSAQWQFKHGRSNIIAPIEDKEWMERFRRGQYPIRPGDALRVRMRSDFRYSEKGDLLEAKQTVIRVFEVMSTGSAQDDLFEGG